MLTTWEAGEPAFGQHYSSRYATYQRPYRLWPLAMATTGTRPDHSITHLGQHYFRALMFHRKRPQLLSHGAALEERIERHKRVQGSGIECRSSPS